MFVVSAEHWTYLHPRRTLDTARRDGSVRLRDRRRDRLLARRLYPHRVGERSRHRSTTRGQLLFLAQLGLLVGAISLALILLEGSYALFIPRG